MAYVGKTLKKGSKGAEVKAVQKKLGINADGVFGNDTYNAVRNFQGRKKLTVDGVVGPKTWAALGIQNWEIEAPSTPKPPGVGGGTSSSGSAGNSGVAMDTVINGPLNAVIGGVLLYGIFKVFMRIF